MKNLSVVIIAKNEEKNIADCIRSCSFADEIVLIDDFSNDATKSIAESLGAKVISRSLNGDFGAQKTYAINSASHKWIFLIDADERISPELCESIKNVIKTEKLGSYLVKRRNYFQHRLLKYGMFRSDSVARLFPKEGSAFVGRVHESLVSPYKQYSLEGYLDHYPYRDWCDYFRKFDLYTTLMAKKNFEKGKRVSPLRDLLLRPFWAFLKCFFVDKGIMDGVPGFIFSCIHAMYTFMKYVKLYFLQISK